MAHLTALLLTLFLSLTVSLAAAQERPTLPLSKSTPQPSPEAVAPPRQQESVPSNATAASTSQQSGGLPSKVTIDFVRPPGSDSMAGWVVALVTATGALLGVLITGVVTVSTSRRSAATQKELANINAELQKELANKNAELQSAVEERKAELQTFLTQLQQEHSSSESSMGRALTQSLEEKRIATERDKLLSEIDARGVDIRIAAEKLVNDKQVEEAKLIHLYFDKLLSQSPQRDLALIALSAFIDKSVMERLVQAGDEEAARSMLSELAGQRVSDAENPAATAAKDPSSDEFEEVQTYVETPSGFVMPGPKKRQPK